MLKKSHRRSGSVGSSFEALEQRRLLSGNVSVTVDPVTGVMNVVGDNKSNQINFQGGPAHSVNIIGENGTTINNAPSIPLPAFTAIKVDMGNGEDSVKFSVVAPITLVVLLGLPLSIDTGNGDDSVSMAGWSSDSSVSIDTGNGGDSISLGDGTYGSLSVDTGNGPDSVAFAGVFVIGNTTIDGGRGPDALSGIASLTTLGTQKIIDVETVG